MTTSSVAEMNIGNSRETDAHWYAAEGLTAAVIHAMLIQPVQVDLASAIEADDPPRAVASAIECLRWVTVCQQVLNGHSTARTALELDLMITAGTEPGPIGKLRDIVAASDATVDDARRAAEIADDAAAWLVGQLPVCLPVRRTPVGYRPAVELVSRLEQLRGRLGLPQFDWEAWIG
jgi:hypothetical protein